MITFDPDPQAIFNPHNLEFDFEVDKAILIFDDGIWHDFILKQATTVPVKNARGRTLNNYRQLKYQDENILLVYPATGGAGAAIDLELVIASGIKNIVSFGTCGVLDKNIPKNSLIIPTAAIREEGVSYHYLADSDEIAISQNFIDIIKDNVKKSGLNHYLGKIWTTDAVYRETNNKLKLMKLKNCIAVDMELASLLAVAQFRGVNLASFLIADDNIDNGKETVSPAKPETILNLAIKILINIINE